MWHPPGCHYFRASGSDDMRKTMFKSQGKCDNQDNMKRRFALFALLLIPYALMAAPWSAGGFAGVRYRSTAPDLVLYGIDASYEGLGLHFSGIGDDDFSLVLGYDLRAGANIHNRFIFHTDNVPGEGGFATIGYLFGQDFAWDWFRLAYGVGVQGSVSYSPFSDPLFSIIPLLDIRLGFEFAPATVMFYFTMVHPESMEARLNASLGATAEFSITENHHVFLDGFIALDNIMDFHTYPISGWGVSAGYIYRGNV